MIIDALLYLNCRRKNLPSVLTAQVLQIKPSTIIITPAIVAQLKLLWFELKYAQSNIGITPLIKDIQRIRITECLSVCFFSFVSETLNAGCVNHTHTLARMIVIILGFNIKDGLPGEVEKPLVCY
jgi:hypothetical protein